MAKPEKCNMSQEETEKRLKERAVSWSEVERRGLRVTINIHPRLGRNPRFGLEIPLSLAKVLYIPCLNPHTNSIYLIRKKEFTPKKTFLLLSELIKK
jgi:hypothetical protein